MCRADDRSRPSRGQSAYAGVDRPQLQFGRRGPADSVLSRPPQAKSRQERPRADPRGPSVARAAPLAPLRPRIAAGAARLPSGLPCRDARRGWSGDPPWSDLSRVHRLVMLTFKLAQSAAGPASWPAVRSVRPARAAPDAIRALEATSPRPRGYQAARGAKRVGLRG